MITINPRLDGVNTSSKTIPTIIEPVAPPELTDNHTPDQLDQYIARKW
jgi:hypothetical protein